jgi:hypothetical protein
MSGEERSEEARCSIKDQMTYEGDRISTLIQILMENNNRYLWNFGIPASVIFQFGMIVRIDDTTQFVLENLQMHDNFPNMLKARQNWSKMCRMNKMHRGTLFCVH